MATPTGLSGAAAISLVRSYSNELALPNDATVLSFLNRGVEEVVRRIGGIRKWAPYPTVVNQTTIDLDSDVQEIISANFSLGSVAQGNVQDSSPFSQGALVYDMVQLEQATFMNAAGGFPNVGFGPPQAYFLFQDFSHSPANTLPIPAQPALNVIPGTSTGALVEVVLTVLNVSGETPPSIPASITPNPAQQAQVLSPQGSFNAIAYDVYAGPHGGPYHLQNASGAIAIGAPFTLPGTLLTGTAQPPSINTAIGAGTGGAMSMQLYPAAELGQVNIYYKARPRLWADTTSASSTNLDSQALEAVLVFGTMRVLQNRQRADESRSIWEPELNSMCPPVTLQSSMNRRSAPKSGQVRDVSNSSYPGAPWWMNG